MKKRSVLSAVAILCCVLLVSANEPRIVTPEKSITEQLEEILSGNAIDADKKDALARVLFTINSEGKIEIMKISSKRKDLRWFLNRKLKGKKLEVSNDTYGEVFVVNVRFTS